jgi:hypothetical protein
MSINVRENQSDNPETLATLGLQCIGRRQAKEKNHTTQKTKNSRSCYLNADNNFHYRKYIKFIGLIFDNAMRVSMSK